jgi:hypothetical protein
MWVTYYNNPPGFGKSGSQQVVIKVITEADGKVTV